MAKKKTKKRKQNEPWSLGDCMAKIQKSEKAAKKKKLSKKEFLNKMNKKIEVIIKKKKSKKKKKVRNQVALYISDITIDGEDGDEGELNEKDRKEQVANGILEAIASELETERSWTKTFTEDLSSYLDEYIKIRFGELLTKVFNSPIIKHKLNQNDLEKIKRGLIAGRI